ncbi:hypothetical protein CRG98_015771, partial [Punica granatum]
LYGGGRPSPVTDCHRVRMVAASDRGIVRRSGPVKALLATVTPYSRLLPQGSEIAKETVGFYQKLLGTVDDGASGGSVEELQNVLGFKLNVDLQANLISKVTEVEIKETLWSMDEDKAPGPDGYRVHFFKTAWSTLSGDFIKAVLNFFNSYKLLKEVN